MTINELSLTEKRDLFKTLAKLNGLDYTWVDMGIAKLEGYGTRPIPSHISEMLNTKKHYQAYNK